MCLHPWQNSGGRAILPKERAREGGRRLRMDVALENLVIEYRRCKASPPLRRKLNLSGKRTGCMAG